MLGLSSNIVRAETLRIAVASNFLKTAQNLAHQFESQTQHKVQISSGSSGKLYLQISKGAPFDLFLSADTQKPHELVENGLAQADSVQTYALGKLLLWLKSCDKPVELSLLTASKIKRIALANPKLAPYGSASQQFLIKKQLWSKLKSKIVFPENISQVSQLAKIGVVDAAFIAASHKDLFGIHNQSCFIDILASDHPPIKQDLVIISSSQHQAAAKEFIDYMKSEHAQNLIKSMGYLTPNSGKLAPIN